MLSRDIIPTEVNYVEISLFDKLIDNGEDVMVMSLPSEESFKFMLNNIKTALGVKTSSKTFKQFILNDLTYNVDPESGDITVIGLKPVTTFEVGQNYISLGFEKKKLSIINFPSTTAYNDIVDVQKMTYRISNRVFINFESRISSISMKSYRIYMNYNHDPNVDWDIVKKDIMKAYKLLNLESTNKS